MRTRLPSRQARPSAFTLIELLVSITIIALLISLVVIGVGAALRTARGAGEKQAAASIKFGVEQFKQEFGFLPPLVLHDEQKTVSSKSVYPVQLVPALTGSPVINTVGSSVSSDLNSNVFLEGFNTTGKGMTADARLAPGSRPDIAVSYTADRRFSEYSLAIYLLGALPGALDGVDGLGMSKPREDGSFEALSESRSARAKGAGRVYQPFIDVSRGAKLDLTNERDAANEPNFPTRYRILAPNGKPYRYYRWSPRKNFTNTGFTKWDFYVTRAFAPEDETDKLGVPSLLGNPRENPELASASYAIVSCGPDGYFGDMAIEGFRDDDLFAMQQSLNVPRGTDYSPRTRDTARRDNIVEVGR